MAAENNNKDLPLTSNTDDILVDHYILQLTCHFECRTFEGKVYLFLNPIKTHLNGSEGPKEDFVFVLDSKDLLVEKVESLDGVTKENKNNLSSALEIFKSAEYCRSALNYKVEDWCIKIWQNGITESESFPRIICIHYKTLPKGNSITWTKDQSDRACCFTHGSWINNRSLFPCQEPPEAMATWQAFIGVPSCAAEGPMVVMTGDSLPQIVVSEEHFSEEELRYILTAELEQKFVTVLK